jgi:predicted N-acetyltransferase YhbS
MGIGKRLLQEGLDTTDEKGLPAILGASIKGYGLYKKVGFEDVDFVEINLGDYGGDGISRYVAMIRPAKKFI